jgi:hypothetical protein
MTAGAPESELIIDCGDLKVSGFKVDRNVGAYARMMKEREGFGHVLDVFESEYEQMTKILSKYN